MNSPFQCGGVVKEFPPLPDGKKLIIRISKTTGATLQIKKNGNPTDNYDYLLYEGEAVEIEGYGNPIVSVVNAGADPDVVWTFEPIHRR